MLPIESRGRVGVRAGENLLSFLLTFPVDLKLLKKPDIY